ncbi:RNA-directed DNA polymerase from mobile element jockey [Procambarus clarkii]|uniref:RNA-directed DNA polymerase from mobile element jockey n=1 Tax=Procambarus clarkii TaxID=6728 RepID=UPI0037429FC5
MLRLFQAALAEARELMVELRQTDWETFVSGLISHTPLSRAWKDINKVKGKNAAEISYPNPLHRANELVDAWATTSSFDSLTLPTQNELNNRYTDRSRLLDFMLHQEDDCDMLFTEYELDSALHKGKDISPGEDGVTYGILHMLLLVPGNPLLQLYNMSYITGELPKSWTNSLIIPIPKPNQQSAFRIISLTSCLYKCLERMVLNRLLYRISNMLSPQIYGFKHGKSVRHCITTFLTLHTDRSYTTFLDLKSAFDTANPHVILSELAKMNVGGWLLRWIRGYLSNRKLSALFQGHRSVTRDFELGTPQGRVLSPTLFNVLINALLNSATRSPSEHIISYADDILIHTNGYTNTQNVLNSVLHTCQELGLVISVRKTKILNRRPPQTGWGCSQDAVA